MPSALLFPPSWATKTVSALFPNIPPATAEASKCRWYLEIPESLFPYHNVVESTYDPYTKEGKDAITIPSNANYMTERRLGRMVETIVSPSFVLPLAKSKFDKEENPYGKSKKANQTLSGRRGD